MVVIAARGNERGLRAVALHQLEAEHADIEIEGALQVGDFQVNMADARAGGNGRRKRGHGMRDIPFLLFRHHAHVTY